MHRSGRTARAGAGGLVVTLVALFFSDLAIHSMLVLTSVVLLTSVLFDYTGIYEQMIMDIPAGEFGQVYTMDVTNGGVRLLDLPESVPAEVQEAVKVAEAAIIDGSLEAWQTDDGELVLRDEEAGEDKPENAERLSLDIGIAFPDGFPGFV